MVSCGFLQGSAKIFLRKRMYYTGEGIANRNWKSFGPCWNLSLRGFMLTKGYSQHFELTMLIPGLLIFRAVADPRNSPKNAKYREIRQKYFQIHVGKTYLILILAIRPVLFTPNVQIYLETSSLQRVNNVPKLPGVLRLMLPKTGHYHNVNSFSIRSFLERTVVERANDYPC